jgi:hypothetical protein
VVERTWSELVAFHSDPGFKFVFLFEDEFIFVEAVVSNAL